MTNKPSTGRKARRTKAAAANPAGTSKLDTLLAMLRRSAGATIDELAAAAGWQKHSVRGALAGSLKKKGHVISSELVDGDRRYRISERQA